MKGLVLVAPSAFSTDALPTVDLPMAIILPACDADVPTLDGQRYDELARFAPTLSCRRQPRSTASRSGSAPCTRLPAT
jgi:hypothetical protein